MLGKDKAFKRCPVCQKMVWDTTKVEWVVWHNKRIHTKCLERFKNSNAKRKNQWETL